MERILLRKIKALDGLTVSQGTTCSEHDCTCSGVLAQLQPGSPHSHIGDAQAHVQIQTWLQHGVNSPPLNRAHMQE